MLKIYNSSWFTFLKITLMLLSFYFIFFHVSQHDVIEKVEVLRRKFINDPETRIYLFAVIVLMICNWLCETLKWKWLTSLFYRQSLLASARAVLTGLAVSFFTPNRSGDFAGRIMLLQPHDRVEGAVFSIIGSFTQMLITLTAGAVALICMMPILFELPHYAYGLTALILTVVVIALHYILFNIRRFWKMIPAAGPLKKLVIKTGDIKTLPKSFLIKVYLLSALRYAIFTLQFILLLVLFDVNMQLSAAASLVMISFLLMSVVPSFALSEIGVRGSVCVFLFSRFTPELPGVLMASTILWLINVVSPAIVGAFGMLYFKSMAADEK